MKGSRKDGGGWASGETPGRADACPGNWEKGIGDPGANPVDPGSAADLGNGDEPGENELGVPGANGFGAPGEREFGNPGVNGLGAPEVNGPDDPDANEFGAPGAKELGAPGASEFGNPDASGLGDPEIARDGDGCGAKGGAPWYGERLPLPGKADAGLGVEKGFMPRAGWYPA